MDKSIKNAHKSIWNSTYLVTNFLSIVELNLGWFGLDYIKYFRSFIVLI